MATLTYAPDYISHPGETLEDVLEDRLMTQAELAERTGMSRKTVNEIIQGKAPITPETALHLEKIFDIPAHFWNAREQQFQEAKARQKERLALENCIGWLKQFPISQMAKLGWIDKHTDKIDQLGALLSFFGVASPKEWEMIWMNKQSIASFRKSLSFTSDPAPVSAWLRFGEKQALSQAPHPPYNDALFRSALLEIRSLTQNPPADCSSSLVEMCLNCGVALVFAPQLSKARISGVTRWLKSDLPLIQMSLRYKTDDHFWFTFFHEAAHILLHGKRDVFLEGSEASSEKEQKKEKEANEWAANFLVPKNKLQAFIDRGDKSGAAVEVFAEDLNIAPSIVVGQLQHINFLPYNQLNNYKRKLSWIES